MRPEQIDAVAALPRLPGWITASRQAGLEDLAFGSGAALSHLQGVLSRDDLPQLLLRERLALQAALACVGFAGRPESAGDLRDAVHLLRPGDLPCPAGAIYLSWQSAIARAPTIKALCRALPDVSGEQIAQWLDVGAGGPVRRAASVLETVLTDAPRAEVRGLILADVALAQSLRLSPMMPLLATGLKRADLRKQGPDLRQACHRAVILSVSQATRQADELLRRAGHLRSLAPKLRAKGAARAVEMFLTRDAVAPSALPLPDRAARRLCDRLVDLGAIRELTGRDTFRLYGV